MTIHENVSSTLSYRLQYDADIRSRITQIYEFERHLIVACAIRKTRSDLAITKKSGKGNKRITLCLCELLENDAMNNC